MSNILVISLVLFNYFPGNTGSVQSFTAPKDGTYKLEVWGAQGGGPSLSKITGGKGAYVKGDISLIKNTSLYIYVGEQPSAGGGGWNGGGSNWTASYGGGGATDIALKNSSWNAENHLYSRIIVAGGGGGFGQVDPNHPWQGGDGGAWNGGDGIGDECGYGATLSDIGKSPSDGSCNTNPISAGFGYGGSNSWVSEGLGGGGGGWYGGGYAGGNGNNGSGGGGSSYAWTSSLSIYYPASSYKPSTSYYLSNVYCQAGSRSGNGYAIITWFQ